LAKPFLSILIPAHNEETRLPRSLAQVLDFLKDQPYSSEVLIVENASTDRTLEVAERFSREHSRVRVVHDAMAGKGRAVRRGILEAKGEYRFIADADFSMPVGEVNRFLPPACQAEIAIASREAPGARRYGEPYFRHLTGRIFNLFIRALVLPGLQDTQCGFKCFHAAPAEEIFRLQTMMGWSFDVEVLAIARRQGFTVDEIGIPWYYTPESKVKVLHDSWRMFLDLLTIRRNLRRGLYDVAR
jgi:dolichyl-phosphate beta-glucosyltransferase